MKENKINFPWDNNIEIIDESIKIGARQCKIINPSIEEIFEFLNKYHYQKSCNGQIIRYGLEYNNELVAIMTFGYSRYNKRFQYELLRLCYHPKYKVTGGSKKLFTQFIKEYTPNSVVSYCDRSKFTGDVYLSLGMKQISKGRPAKHYWREKDKKHITNIELVRLGADKLIGTNYGKGTNNEEILLNNGFEIIKDCGQDTYLYLNENEYFGYIYCTTDNKTGKKYVGQKLGNKFDNTYFGSGSIISKIVKIRPEDLDIELIEWCKQDISEREIYYIKKFNTLMPNGYNLTTRIQRFDKYTGPNPNVTKSLLKFAKSKKGKQHYIENGKRIAEFYSSEEGKEVSKRIAQKRHEFCQTEEGKQWLKKRSEKFSNYCKTNKGKLMCLQRNKKLKDLNKTEEGKIKEQKRIQSLRDFYNSEEGKIARQKQIEKAKQNPDYEKIKQKRADSFKKWANSEEGNKKLREASLASLIKRANSMNEEEWSEFIKKHPNTRLINYRNK